jgi:BirA family biotin operon repressor/biotin-[acetyl-CoA-carboxylase] ligase
LEIKKIIYYDEIDSTNIEVDRLAQKGAEHGMVVVAEQQSAGKGRRGRQWESPKGVNLYMSLLLRPEMEPQKAPMLTLVMAYSIAKALRGIGFANTNIKWPNDLILGDKKVCGILTEMRLDGSDIDYIVVGVGVNVNTTVFPKELEDKATSLYLECGKRIEIETVQNSILTNFTEDYEKFLACGDLTFLCEAYNEMLINRGREVLVLEPNQEYQALALGINKSGELIVEMEDGSKKEVYAGEVSVRGIYGYT